MGDGASPSKHFPFALDDSNLDIWIAEVRDWRRVADEREAREEKEAEARTAQGYDDSDPNDVLYAKPISHPNVLISHRIMLGNAV